MRYETISMVGERGESVWPFTQKCTLLITDCRLKEWGTQIIRERPLIV